MKAEAAGTGHVFVNIARLFTLRGAVEKQGRCPTETDLGMLENAAIAVDETDRIVWVGGSSSLPEAYRAWPRLARTGETWIPAPVECHTHLVYSGSRAREFGMRCGGLTYQQIAEKGGGILSTVQSTRASSLDDLVQLASGRLGRFQDQGIGAVEIKSGYGLTLESEIKLLEVVQKLSQRTTMHLVPTFLPAHAVPPEFKGRADEYVQEICLHWIPEVAKRGLAVFFDAFVEKGYFDLTQTEKMASAAKDAGLRIKLHVDQFNSFGGAELAARLGAVSADHLDRVEEMGMNALAKSETVAVLAPGASLFAGTPYYPPARKLIDAGVRIALTTDHNPGTCPSTNLGLMMTIAATQMKMTLPETLVAATYGAAAALGLADQMGSLTVGKKLKAAVLPFAEAGLEASGYEIWPYGFGESAVSPVFPAASPPATTPAPL